MAGNITNAAEDLFLDWMNPGQAAPTRPSALKLRLMTANGDDATAGTEVTGGSYVAQTLTLDAAASGGTSNSALISYSGMPSCTVVGVEIWDTEATPRRWWWGALAANKVVNVGDTFDFQAGELTISLD